MNLTLTNRKALLLFLAGWTLLNIMQAFFTELHADEAYYWMYSRFLAWGYFDHPPMVALFIKIGDFISHSALGLRLCTIISSTLSAYLLWKIAKPYSNNIKLFVLLFTSMVLFHIYGFITTPDSPLFFFSTLFFYVYQRYVFEDKIKWALLLGLICALLLYSKYHGILIIFFTIISNLNLFKRKSFFICIILTIILFSPHIWWQYVNHFPSLYFHLIDRSIEPYSFSNTLEYLLPQLFLAGPFLGWILFPIIFKTKTTDLFQLALKFNIVGIFIFFIISTLKGRVEAHWTLLSFIPFLILSFIHLSKRTTLPKLFNSLALTGISLILLLRIILMIPIPYLKNIPAIAEYFGSEKWAHQLAEKAGNKPVMFINAFQEPSKYNFYTNTTKGYTYDSRYYRKTQYDIWPLEDSISNKTVYFIDDNHTLGDIQNEEAITTTKGIKYGTWLSQVRLYQKIQIETINLPLIWKSGEIRPVKISIYNPYNHAVSFTNYNQKWTCSLEYGYNANGNFQDFNIFSNDFNQLEIASKQTSELVSTIQAPKIPGTYKLIFSIKTQPFLGSRNSSYMTIQVR